MTGESEHVRAHLRARFADIGVTAEPDSASVTFLGVEPIQVLRFGPDPDGVVHHVSVGCSRYPMHDPTAFDTDPVRGPRAEVVVRMRTPIALPGLARSVAVVAAAPAVEGLVLCPDALVDLGQPLWRGLQFTAFLLGAGSIPDLTLPPPREPVVFFEATPITSNEAAWVRLKGADELRQTWRQDGVDVADPARQTRR